MRFPHLYSLIHPVDNLPAKASANSADEDGAAIDLVALNNQFHSGLVLVSSGAATGSPSAFSVVWTLEESSDNTNWTVAKNSNGEDAIVTQTAAGVAKLDFFPNQLSQYVRLNRTVSITGGSSPTVPTHGMVLLGGGRQIPYTP